MLCLVVLTVVSVSSLYLPLMWHNALISRCLQMMGNCSRAAELGTRLDHAASKGTLWAVGSCFLATTASMVEVNVFLYRLWGRCASSCTIPYCFSCSVSGFPSDDVDDWDLEVFPKPSEVQNDLYASNEDEEDEGEDLEGRKVTVRCWKNSRNIKPRVS